MEDSGEIRQRFLSGELNDREHQAFLEWLADPANRKDTASFFQAVWDRAASGKEPEHQGLDAIKRAILSSSPGPGRPLRILLRFLRSAAVWMIPVLFGIAIYWFFRPDKQVEMVTLTAEHGQVQSHILPDSSKLWINAGSKVSYPENMEKGLRRVSLEGEAYFQVSSFNKDPFRVSVGAILIEVTGTAFNACCYENEDHITVTLSSGELGISTENNNEQIILSPGEQVRYNKLNNELFVLSVDPENYSSWIKGQIVFRNMPLKDVLLKLERKYDVCFILEDPDLRQRPITGTIRDESLAEMLRLIQLTSPIQYEIKDSEVILCPKDD